MNLPSTIKYRIGAGLLLVFLLLSSCDEMQRQRTLSFFFDGVGPLRGDGSAARPTVPKGRPAAAGAPVDTWYVHEPVKDCTQCHGHQPRRSITGKVQLLAEVPQLCYRCHEGHASLQGWVHGPVAAGNCLLCHGQHKTKNASLLLKPIPELCYQCHDARVIRTIDRHAEESYARCTDCHEPHASTARSLLRPAVAAAGPDARGEGILPLRAADILPALRGQDALDTKIQGRDALATKEQGQDALAAKEQGQDPRGTPERAVAELYYRSLKQYHLGQLREARDGFLEALRTGLLPDPIRETVNECLENINQALQEPPRP